MTSLRCFLRVSQLWLLLQSHQRFGVLFFVWLFLVLVNYLSFPTVCAQNIHYILFHPVLSEALRSMIFHGV